MKLFTTLIVFLGMSIFIYVSYRILIYLQIKKIEDKELSEKIGKSTMTHDTMKEGQ